MSAGLYLSASGHAHSHDQLRSTSGLPHRDRCRFDALSRACRFHQLASYRRRDRRLRARNFVLAKDLDIQSQSLRLEERQRTRPNHPAQQPCLITYAFLQNSHHWSCCVISPPISSALRLNLGHEELPRGSSNLPLVEVSILLSQEAGKASWTSGMHFLSLRTESDTLLMVACRECGAVSFGLRTASPS